MGQLQQLSAFYNAVAADKRIGATHISLYMALFQMWNLNQFQNPVTITRQEVMPIARINGRATYHKCIKELEEYGYIKYIPSYNPFLKSLVYILNFKPVDEKEKQ